MSPRSLPHALRRLSLLPLALIPFLLSCGGSDGGTQPETPRLVSLQVGQPSVSLSFIGATQTLSVSGRDQNGGSITATVTWVSDDATVASITAGGVVTAVANGSTTVRASSNGVTASVPVTVAQVVTSVVAVSGDAQSATVGQALPQPVVVEGRDAGGAPTPSVGLSFAVTQGGGSLSVATATTDAGGRASFLWTLGTVSGAQTVAVAVAGGTTPVGQLTATGLAAAATALEKSAGDAQVGPVGTALPEPVVVRVLDVLGNGVAGVSVGFAVTSGGGSVTPSSVPTGSDGKAQATWTMGAALGPAGLSASAAGLTSVSFSATASSAAVPVPDVFVGALTASPSQPTSLETVIVTVPVDNIGTGSTGAAFPVRVLVDGAEVSRQSVGPIAAGGSAVLTFDLGMLTSGTRSLTAEADPDGAIAESNESNNFGSGSVNILAATSLVAGTPLLNVGAPLEVELLFAFVLPAEDGSIEFQLSGGTGDADMYVHRGSRPAARDNYECISGAFDSNELCRFNAARADTYYVLIHAFTAFSGTTLTATTGLPVLPFNIDLAFINHGTASQDAAFAEAAARWEQIVFSDLPDFSLTGSNIIGAGQCTEGQPAVNEVVDDLKIFVDIVSIDGPFGTLASAGPCVLRPGGGLPILGTMRFDLDDLARLETQGEMTAVILHEMAHVLGLGSLWNRAGLLKNPSLPSNTGADTYFNGPLAIAAFDAAGGSSYTGGRKVPVENVRGSGSGDSHWRESLLVEELMTPLLNSGSFNPLSAISIRSLDDLGYRVDASLADAFSKVFSLSNLAGFKGPVIDLSDDVRKGPILVVYPKGRIVRLEGR